MRAVFKHLFFSPFCKSKSSHSFPLSIADVLLLQDHEEQSLVLMDGCRGLNCSTLCRIAARLFSGLKRCKMQRIIGERKKEDGEAAPPDVSDAPDSSPSERCRRESNFNVGIGCCLVQLVAECKNELQKMTELRIQMESVLQNVKQELRNNDLLVAKKLESNDGVEEGLGFNSNLRSNKDDCLVGMDRLEAELEVELERLQHHLDSGKLSTNPPHETIEEGTVNTSVRSYSKSYGEVIDPTIDGEEKDCWDSHSGVPPHELERKLRELVETRQEQQIRELEAALESARQELLEKEREISWWKDTARLMSRHVEEPSRLNLQHGQHPHPIG
ncbi:protein POLAR LOCALIZATION DURING ASYMMETRIC DIVISION AND REDISTRIBUTION-like [Durio zibethinus]|uniref:Protein POLAR LOCALIZATION DURING ASYMMETRIC DIVISION AND REDISTRIBUTION-like n=1 Tax=Durio zibethinus TaxID=66656 RepID=A0A6P5XRQ7_DURZI|nr:protein POLAR LOCALIZATION DURING ASYMMETRIC DIVISION AND REDISTRIBUTION-like [Durio zibethinus]